MRMVSMVWAAARKCHAMRPKKLRCSMTVVSIFPAFTAYFENKMRYCRISPDRNGTGVAAGAAGAAGVLARDLGGFLDCCAQAQEAQASSINSAVTQAIRRSLEDERRIG